MNLLIGIDEIRTLGFEWPRYKLIEEHSTTEQGKIDLTRSLEEMRSNQAYYGKQLADAYKFKTQHSADYSDFTDRFDEYAQKKRRLDEAIAYLEEIKLAVENPEED
jgi:septal ring factor EnvC (AmiA/AmiB activator)